MIPMTNPIKIYMNDIAYPYERYERKDSALIRLAYRLCNKYKITLREMSFWNDAGDYNPFERLIRCAPIHDLRSFLTFMHELGHGTDKNVQVDSPILQRICNIYSPERKTAEVRAWELALIRCRRMKIELNNNVIEGICDCLTNYGVNKEKIESLLEKFGYSWKEPVKYISKGYTGEVKWNINPYGYRYNTYGECKYV